MVRHQQGCRRRRRRSCEGVEEDEEEAVESAATAPLNHPLPPRHLQPTFQFPSPSHAVTPLMLCHLRSSKATEVGNGTRTPPWISNISRAELKELNAILGGWDRFFKLCC